MVGKGRPRTGTPILVRIPDDLLADLDAEADALNTTRAELIRVIIRLFFLKDPS